MKVHNVGRSTEGSRGQGSTCWCVILCIHNNNCNSNNY